MTSGNLDIELYKITQDIGKQDNVAVKYLELIEKLAKMMANVRTPSEVYPLRPFDKPAQRSSKRGECHDGSH